VYDLTELLETLEKNGFHRDEMKIVRPNKVGPAGSAETLTFPSTLQELDNLLSWIDNNRLGKVVGQLLVSGNVSFGQCQNLLGHLGALAAASDRLRPMLQNILKSKPDPKDEAVGEKK